MFSHRQMASDCMFLRIGRGYPVACVIQLHLRIWCVVLGVRAP